MIPELDNYCWVIPCLFSCRKAVSQEVNTIESVPVDNSIRMLILEYLVHNDFFCIKKLLCNIKG